VQAGQVEEDNDHPLLRTGSEGGKLLLVITSDRGLCGSFNSSINKHAELVWREAEREGRAIKMAIIGRKGRDYFRRRGAPVAYTFDKVWDDLSLGQARIVARAVLQPLLAGEVSSIHLVYNEFKSAMTQKVVNEPLFPLDMSRLNPELSKETAESELVSEYIFEPSRAALLERLVPMYIEVSILRALYESMASELGARMTAMDAATNNANDMISRLTLSYNRARQAAITTEILEIIGGAEALNA
jgi:F-type H+-transporting ATPase subunit gamma